MTDPFGLRRCVARVFFVALFACALILAGSISGHLDQATAADPRLEKAQAEKAEIQQRLDRLTRQIDETQSAVTTTRDELERLRGESEQHHDAASDADRRRTERVRESYMRGGADPVLRLLTAEDATDILDQARFLTWLSTETREDFEHASAAQVRTEAIADHTADVVEQLRARESALAEQHAEAEKLFERAVAAEKAVKELIADEEAEAARRAAATRASRSSRGAPSTAAPAPVTGGVACPVGTPRTYIDSWGAARSGGRSHKGTDILAPRGTVAPAYESGVISRLSSNSLGGISLYLRGDSGNVYYYTHLSGYAGVSEGQRVQAGQVIAYVGSTGNAGGTNHLHFEVRPGGGGNVNPYPYVRRACG